MIDVKFLKKDFKIVFLFFKKVFLSRNQIDYKFIKSIKL